MNTRIIRKDVAKSVLKVMHNEIRKELEMAPSWVSERVEDFAGKCNLLPFVKTKAKSKLGGGAATVDVGAVAGYAVTEEVIGSQGDVVEELGRMFQEFYLDLEEELARRKWRFGKQGLFGSGTTHANGGASVGSMSSGDEKEKDIAGEEKDGEDQVEDEREKRVREVMEMVERTICSMFYDKYAAHFPPETGTKC